MPIKNTRDDSSILVMKENSHKGCLDEIIQIAEENLSDLSLLSNEDASDDSGDKKLGSKHTISINVNGKITNISSFTPNELFLLRVKKILDFEGIKTKESFTIDYAMERYLFEYYGECLLCRCDSGPTRHTTKFMRHRNILQV